MCVRLCLWLIKKSTPFVSRIDYQATPLYRLGGDKTNCMKKETSLLYSSKALCEQTIGRSSDLSPFATFPIQLTCISGFFSRTTLLPVSSVVRTHSSGSVTDSHRIPFSIRALLLIPTIYINLLSANRGQRYCFFSIYAIPASYFLRIFVYGLQQQTPAYPSERYAGVCVYVFIPMRSTAVNLENDSKTRRRKEQTKGSLKRGERGSVNSVYPDNAGISWDTIEHRPAASYKSENKP